MKKQLMIIGIIVILLTVGFSGCNEENESKYSIVGTWTERDSGSQFIFREDGTCVITANISIDATYTINATVIKLTITYGGENITSDFGYKFLSNNILSMTPFSGEGEEIIYDRT
ncbi:MAG: hypothetical protein MUO82_02165 [Candidatus Thermoplasmatota archaeon]|nr:hypothetical protein [Candidatus Thermoplasmatota archaeon]